MIGADTLKRLAALQLAPEVMQEVLSIIASCIEPLERRRQRDRERQVRRRSTGMSRDIPCDTSPPIYNTPPREKPKKVSLSIDVPENPSDKNIEDAVSRGWTTEYAKSEWQRFRDWSLNRGRKHKNVDAAWRNWVTSPYQKPVENGHVQATQRQPGGSYGAALDRGRAAHAKLRASIEADERETGGGTVVEFLPAAVRE